MWSRDTRLEPDTAKSTIETVSHAVEVSLTHFFARSGVILLPSVSKCEAMPLLQIGRRMATQEAIISGVIFPLAETRGDCVAVMLSEAIGNKVVGPAQKWDDRLARLKENATTLVEPLCKSLRLPAWTEPSFIFDMQGAAVQAMAAHAATDRSTALVIGVHLNGLDAGEWATILAIVSQDRVSPRSELGRAA